MQRSSMYHTDSGNWEKNLFGAIRIMFNRICFYSLVPQTSIVWGKLTALTVVSLHKGSRNR